MLFSGLDLEDGRGGGGEGWGRGEGGGGGTRSTLSLAAGKGLNCPGNQTLSQKTLLLLSSFVICPDARQDDSGSVLGETEAL